VAATSNEKQELQVQKLIYSDSSGFATGLLLVKIAYCSKQQ